MILEPICAPDLSQDASGFRPGRSTHRARTRVWRRLVPQAGSRWSIAGEIASFCAHVPPKLMLRCLKRRIRAKKLLKLVWRCLRAGVMEEGTVRKTTRGTPQGGISSPLRAPIYRHEVDRDMERRTKRSHGTRHDNRQKGMATFLYTRYADDFVVRGCGTKHQAEAMPQARSQVLANELSLARAMDKTKVTHLQAGCTCLGFHVSRGRGSPGKILVRVRIPEEAVKSAQAKPDLRLKAQTALSVHSKIWALNSVIRGWGQSYQ